MGSDVDHLQSSNNGSSAITNNNVDAFLGSIDNEFKTGGSNYNN